VRELAGRDEAGAMMLLYEFVLEETSEPGARRLAAEDLVRRGLLRRERSGASPTFVWLAMLTAAIMVIGAASIAGPVAAIALAAVAVALGVYAVRRRDGGEGEGVYLGPQGERIHISSGEARHTSA
jgi:hypothetical protein